MGYRDSTGYREMIISGNPQPQSEQTGGFSSRGKKSNYFLKISHLSEESFLQLINKIFKGLRNLLTQKNRKKKEL